MRKLSVRYWEATIRLGVKRCVDKYVEVRVDLTPMIGAATLQTLHCYRRATFGHLKDDGTAKDSCVCRTLTPVSYTHLTLPTTASV